MPGVNFIWQSLQPDGTIKPVSAGKKSGTQKISKIGVNKFQCKADGHVLLAIYNMVGQKVATVIGRDRPAGYHAHRLDAEKWPGSVYFYELQVNDFRALKRMILAK